ncbi:hypothetical protein [Actinomadura macrotermitis]|uniref:Uncharacterized protein n=1 Tax=Actinomadura macrotermitis TaxID=2585200 RepID=A0A7K0BYU2_9ACTN|nr:hypothetical protein [Actinomadura macrotermitis]MQY06032.1 hypothetical protein [Actinomadura macrotermitis]
MLVPSSLHEALCEMFRDRPELAAEVLTSSLGLAIPAYRDAQIRSGGVTDDRMAELRADVVVEYADQERKFAVIVEVQLGHDAAKGYSWPLYMMGLRQRLRCPVMLLAICPKRPVARTYMRPIDLGHPGMTLTPLVVGPDQIPYITDPEEAVRTPELAVLSALAHGALPEGRAVLAALPDAYSALDRDHRALYHDLVQTALPEAARRFLAETMKLKNYEYQSEFAREYFGKGKVEGQLEATAKLILRALAAQGVCVSNEARERIAGCRDLEQLEAWFDRATTVSSTRELFQD